jgi:predicted transcriptional regulator YheO
MINGFHSGRSEGAPITDLALTMLEKINENGGGQYITYYSKSKYGKPVKSVTLTISGEHGRVIGLVCINMYMDSPITSLLQSFTMNGYVEYVSENFSNDSDELIYRSLERVKKEVETNDAVPLSQKNKEIVTLLYHLGIFKLKNAVKVISGDLGISKNTVYMHLRALE